MVDEILQEPKFDRSPVPDDVRAFISAGANGDERFFRAYQTVLTQNRATLTHRNNLKWAQNHNISTRPVDASWGPNFDVDINDPLTREIAFKDNPHLIPPAR
jgi:hypothetical protein